jgi:hypothetical protein
VTLLVAGTGGLPASGIAAVVVTLAGVEPAGATQLWIGPTGSSKPKVQTVTMNTAGQAASGFALIPVSGGKLTIWNGAAATDFTLDVYGWVSSASESGTAGLFDGLASRTAYDTAGSPLNAGERRTIALAGSAGIPSTGASAVLLRVHTSAAVSSGILGVVPATPTSNSRHITTIAYPSGDAQDLAFVALSGAGKVILFNQGADQLGVSLDVVGYVTDGSDPNAIGDALTPIAPTTVLSGEVSPSGTTVQLAGQDGVPSMTDPVPPTSVLMRIAASDPSNEGALLVDPSDTEPTGTIALDLHAGQRSAAVDLVMPGTTGAVTASTTSGTATITAQALAYLSGSLQLQPNLTVLDAAALAAITSVTPDTVSFQGIPASLSDVAVGDVISAGASPTTPQGLLRIVAGVDTSGGNLALSTTQASLSDAVAQGRLSAGSGELGQAPPVGRPGGRSRQESPNDGCSVGGDLFAGSLSATCSASYDANDVTVSVGAGASLNLSFDASIHFGFPPSLDFSATASAGVSLTGILTAHLNGQIDKQVQLPSWIGEPIDLQIGPVPVVIVPEVDPSLEISGQFSADQTLSGTVSAGAALSYSTQSGASVNPTFDASGSGTLGAQAVAGEVKVSFVPAMKADLYDSGAGLSAAVVPYVKATVDPCNVSGYAGADLDVSLSLGKFVPDADDISWSWNAAQFQLFTFPWHACPYFVATFTYSANAPYYVWPQDPRWTFKANDSSVGVVPDLGGPPGGGAPYTVDVTGSGSEKLTDGNAPCGDGTESTSDTWTNAPIEGWAGDNDIHFTISESNGQDREWSWEIDQPHGPYGAYGLGAEVTHSQKYNKLHKCVGYSDTRSGWVSLTGVAFGMTPLETVDLPANATEATGTLKFTDAYGIGDGAPIYIKLHYDIVRKCSMGASDC